MKTVVEKKKLDRVMLENPFSQEKYEQRLINQKAVNLKDNCIVEEFKNGYSRTRAIDSTKVFI